MVEESVRLGRAGGPEMGRSHPRALVNAPRDRSKAFLSERQKFGLWAVLILVLAAVVQAYYILNPDLAWLFTADEKWLSGQRIYSDVFEVNPPISVLMYMPAVLLSRFSHIAPEDVVLVLVLAAVCLSAFLVWKISAGVLESERLALRQVLVILFLTTIFPVDTFGQRDQIAVVALFPFVALAGARRASLNPSRLLAFLAGVGAGIAMAIKPHYALAAGLPLLLNAATARSLKPVFGLETWSASAVVLAYYITAPILFPAYFGTNLDSLLLAYVPVRESWWRLIGLHLVGLITLLGALICLRFSDDRSALRWGAPWIAAALGGVGVYLVIGKGWSYTGYGMLTFALVPILTSLTTQGEYRPLLLRWGARLLSAGTTLLCMGWLMVGPQFAYLTGPVSKIAPHHPKIISITSNIAVGHPLVRVLHGEWVGTSAAQVLAADAMKRERIGGITPATRAKLDRIIEADRQRLLADIRRGKPDIILVDQRLFRHDFDWGRWAKADPALAAELTAYHEVELVKHRILIWQRNPGA
ncbi:MAG: hypothetical protein ACREEB_18160 [Caulobacteraceae bacterium]